MFRYFRNVYLLGIFLIKIKFIFLSGSNCLIIFVLDIVNGGFGLVWIIFYL